MAGPARKAGTQRPVQVGRPLAGVQKKIQSPSGYGKKATTAGRPGVPASSASSGGKKGKKIGQGGLVVSQSYAGGAAVATRDRTTTPDAVIEQATSPTPTAVAPVIVQGGVFSNLAGGRTPSGQPSLLQPKIPKQL